ncbi:MAG: Uma2 family endonuclease [Planctomycetaceae bacterium]|nr:Uma2 family endonuclease [Planctomycetaceae bacterium]
MSPTLEQSKVYTPEDLLTMPDGDQYELVNGRLRARSMSTESSWIAGELLYRLRAFDESLNRVWVLPEGTSYQCFPFDPLLVRKAGASVIVRTRMPGGPSRKGHCQISPDVAIEVNSPNDLVDEVDAKVDAWLAAGTTVVVVASPRTRHLMIYRQSGPVLRLDTNDVLTLEDVLPGFSCSVEKLFPPVLSNADSEE